MFDEVATRYDRLVDWPKRLAREAPFFRDLFQRHDVHRVLDVACGTGHHAAMFHSWGLDVVGIDISAAMLDECHRLHGTNERLHWRQHSFMEALEHTRTFDAVVCLGNSLALVNDACSMGTAVRLLVKSLRPGGVGAIQVLNLQVIAEGPTQWQKVKRIDEDDRPRILLKGIHRNADRGFVELMELRLSDHGVAWHSQSASFLGIGDSELCEMIRTWGGEVDGVFGSYDRDPFVADQSSDLITTWWRGRCG